LLTASAFADQLARPINHFFSANNRRFIRISQTG
jgi:hypothetical protein